MYGLFQKDKIIFQLFFFLFNNVHVDNLPVKMQWGLMKQSIILPHKFTTNTLWTRSFHDHDLSFLREQKILKIKEKVSLDIWLNQWIFEIFKYKAY